MSQIAILKETQAHEKRVAASLFSVQKYIAKGFEVIVESGAGEASNISDEAYQNAGAKIADSAKQALENATIVLKVQPPKESEINFFKENQYLICHLQAFTYPEIFKKLVQKKVQIFALERIPRISRAQSMDILSSQANAAGYKAVLDGAQYLPRVMPMMMTAAGTIRAAKVLVMGTGVAGLQAIATAKRLGAIVSATDVRPSTKEQVESLGAKFVAVENEEFKQAQSSAGYAKAMSEDYQKEQNELIKKVICDQDIVITTALIPNKKAPILIDKAMVQSMKSGSVIVDLAAVNGGNCELTKADEIIHQYGVSILGYSNPASRLAETTSELLAKNIYNFIELFGMDEGKINLNLEDEIINQTLISQEGKVRFDEYQHLIK